jgi:hypothetical protein
MDAAHHQLRKEVQHYVDTSATPTAQVARTVWQVLVADPAELKVAVCS